MDIDQLRNFLAVVDCGSISTAAHSLGINQPALSKTIRRMERQLGVELFERQARGVMPTEYGRTLAHFALAMDSNYRAALRQLEGLRDAHAGELVIGAGGTWLEAHLPRAVARLICRRPTVRIRVITDSPERMLEQLLRGELDLLLAPIRPTDASHEDLVTEVLMTGDHIVVARAGHSLAARPDVDLVTLATQGWVLPTGSYTQERFDGLFIRQGIEPPVPTVELRDSPALFDIVEHSNLLTYVPSLRLGHRAGCCVHIRSSQATCTRDTGLISRRDSPLAPLALEFLTELKALTRDRVETSTA